MLIRTPGRGSWGYKASGLRVGYEPLSDSEGGVSEPAHLLWPTTWLPRPDPGARWGIMLLGKLPGR